MYTNKKKHMRVGVFYDIEDRELWISSEVKEAKKISASRPEWEKSNPFFRAIEKIPVGKEDYFHAKKQFDETSSHIMTRMYERMIVRLENSGKSNEESIQIAAEYMRKYGREQMLLMESGATSSDIRMKRDIWREEFLKGSDIAIPDSRKQWEGENLLLSDDKKYEENLKEIKEKELPDDWLDMYAVSRQIQEEEQKNYYAKIDSRTLESPDDPAKDLHNVEIISKAEESWEKVLDMHIIDSSESIMEVIRQWKSAMIQMIDENGVSDVQCTYLPNGDYVLQFPWDERILIDGGVSEDEIKKEIEFIQEIAKTPILRRILSGGTAKFMEFRKNITRKYAHITAVSTPEGFIDLALSEILHWACNENKKMPSSSREMCRYIQWSLDGKWNLSQTQALLRNHQSELIELLTLSGVIRQDGKREILTHTLFQN